MDLNICASVNCNFFKGYSDCPSLGREWLFWQLSEGIEKRIDGRLNVGEVKGGKGVKERVLLAWDLRPFTEPGSSERRAGFKERMCLGMSDVIMISRWRCPGGS